MADVCDKVFVKVDNNNKYSSSGTFKNLKELYTYDGVLYPKNDLSRYYNPVISSFGNNPNAFKQVYSTSTSTFVNESEGIKFPNDLLADAVDPILSGRLYKANVDYPLMNLYMVKLLDYYSKPKTEKVLLTSGTYTFNQWGCTNNTSIKNTGIIELQGGGGGSGGTNNSGDDSGGGGGGAGAFAAVYYRIKKTNNVSATCSMTISLGAGGTAGASGSGVGGTGGTTQLTFTSHSGNSCYVFARGGNGGTGGNYNYTPGGSGGGLAIQRAGETEYTIVAGGGAGGSESNDTAGTGTVAGIPTAGALDWADTAFTLIDDEYLIVVVLKAKGGAGGGRGDDTGGSFQAKNGGNSFPVLSASGGRQLKTVPYSCDSDNVITYSIFAGGTAIESYSGAGGGGGGASVFAKGGNSGANSAIGSAGSLGSGAGGSGIGGNANRAGAAGGAGIAYIYV